MPNWSFTQLGGDQKQLVLSGWLAPFGRPRKQAIFKETIKSRVQTTHYPGSKNPPTYNVFGTHWEPMEINGRWMTKATLDGAITANAIADDWTDFMRDEQSVHMSWGNIFSYVVFIEELELARESEHEIAWRMKLLVDQRDDASQRTTITPAKPFADQISGVAEFLDTTTGLQAQVEDTMDLDFLSQLTLLAGSLNQFSAIANQYAGYLDDAEKATFSVVAQFRGAVTGMKNAILSMRDAVINADIDEALSIQTAESQIAWVQYQLSMDSLSNSLLGIVATMDQQAELLQSPAAGKYVVAQGGDTWESLATRAGGGPSQAAAIRNANGASYGEQPIVGEFYLVP